MANNVVQNDSKGYGYNYASLSDIAKQGFTIPKMKTGTENGKEYIFYKDGDDWLRGAEIVIPENIINKDGKAKMNRSQLYGSALTYARRFTTLLALSLATDDDADIENGEEIFDEPVTITELANEFRKLYSEEEQRLILQNYNVVSAEAIDKDKLIKYINNRNGKK